MPERNLKVALIPLDITSLDVAGNLQETERKLSSITTDTDLVVLPEMFTSGFVDDASLMTSVAEPDDGRTLSAVRFWSARFGFAIWGSFVGRAGEGIANRGFMMEPDGSCRFYDKRHLFSMGGEAQIFTPGKEMAPVVSFRGWNLRMAICYDLRFPVWNRNVALAYDALIVPANWPHARAFAWQHLLIGRAVENQAYVVGCNRTGVDLYGEYFPEDSWAFNHWGQDISSLQPDGTVYCIFDAAKLNKARDGFPVWRDADSFELLIE